jgi:hypothetical protein
MGSAVGEGERRGWTGVVVVVLMLVVKAKVAALRKRRRTRRARVAREWEILEVPGLMELERNSARD